jgi:hypothetical protein
MAETKFIEGSWTKVLDVGFIKMINLCFLYTDNITPSFSNFIHQRNHFPIALRPLMYMFCDKIFHSRELFCVIHVILWPCLA